MADLTAATFELVLRWLDPAPGHGVEMPVGRLRQTLGETPDCVDEIRSSREEGWTYHRDLSAMHVIDHLDRRADRCDEPERWATAKADIELAVIAKELTPAAEVVREALVHGERGLDQDDIQAARQRLPQSGSEYREHEIDAVRPNASMRWKASNVSTRRELQDASQTTLGESVAT